MSTTTTPPEKTDTITRKRWLHRALWITFTLAVLTGILWARGCFLLLAGIDTLTYKHEGGQFAKAGDHSIPEDKLPATVEKADIRDLTRGLELYTKGTYHIVQTRIFFRDLSPNDPRIPNLGYEYADLGKMGYKEIPIELRAYQITGDMFPYGYKPMRELSDKRIPLDPDSSNYVLAHFYKPVLGSSPIYAFAKIDNFNGIQSQEYARAYGKFDIWGIFELEHD